MSESIGKSALRTDTLHIERKEPIVFSDFKDPNIQAILTQRSLLLLAALSIFLVFAHWNVFGSGQYIAGWNTTMFYAGIIFLLHKENTRIDLKVDWSWVVPIALIALSFSLFENPWLKLISIFVLPFAIGIFYLYGQLANKKSIVWGKQLLVHTMFGSLKTISHIGPAKKHWIKKLPKGNTQKRKQIFKGFALLIPAFIVVTILLSSADKNFAALIEPSIHYFFSLNNISFYLKVFFSVIAATILLSVLFGLRKAQQYTETETPKVAEDIVYGILMSGILVLYIAFLYLQFEYLLVDSLPNDFSQTEQLVKSGFWQLFILSIINVLLFIGIYKKTSLFVQHILRMYILASGLILLSACWRILLYVKWYGLSYEKYFAAYTCIFALLIFAYLLWASFAKTRKDTVRFLVFAMLWSYAIATISPIEKIIYHTNHQLSVTENSRIDLSQLKSLSVDILGDVQNDIVDRQLSQDEWQAWLTSIETHRCDNRRWYETNVSQIANCYF